MTDQIKITPVWNRIIFVVIFWIVFYITQLVVAAVVVAQCIFSIATNHPNKQLMTFGDSLGKYIHDILRYVTFNSDKRPFPFSDFPKADLIIPAEQSS